MKLYKIKNKYLFNSKQPEGIHTYAVYYDRTSKKYKAIATTHLYIKDDKRFRQVSKGNIAVTKFKEFEVPTGVQNYYYSKNINGGKIDVKDKKHVFVFGKNHLPKKQSAFLKSFAKKDYNKKNSHK